MIKLILLFAFYCLNMIAAVDFDTSMMAHNVVAHKMTFTDQLISKARMLYQLHNPWVKSQKNRRVIPKIIHHVWLGPPLSQEDRQLRASWFHFNPGYKYILWTDRVENDEEAVVATSWQQIDDLLDRFDVWRIVVDMQHITFDNRCFYDAAPNYGEKSDILKYQIVYQLGGMYVDCDFQCLKSFDALFDRYDFFTGIQPYDTQVEQLGAALFAAKPHHPILEHAVTTIKNDRHYVPIVLKTGPIHFSRSFVAAAGQSGNVDIAFPATFFYPCGCEQRGCPAEFWLRPESYAVHHWAGSWLSKEAFEQ